MGDLLTVHDQMKREVTFSFPPQRIISLVPSQTEFLLDIGVSIVGRTKFCIHPEKEVPDIPIIGGTKNFRFDKIKDLEPDLIIGNKEENYQEGIEKLEKDFPVWMSDIYTLKDSFDMMGSLGNICGREGKANSMMNKCKSTMEAMKGSKTGRVIYLIWKNPWMAAGSNTFINHLLEHLGYENLITESRYPELTSQQIQDLDPDFIFFSSEPFPFKKSHLEEAKDLWPDVDCKLVDGELHSWYGSRLRHWSV